MTSLLKDARILSMREGQDIYRGDVYIEDGKIVKIADSIEGQADFVYDCQGNLLLPGFKNAHTHSPMTFSRSYSDDLPLQEWLFNRIFPLEDLIKPGDQYHLCKLAILEYLSSGMTACFDMYYSPLEMARASEELGFKTVLLGTVNDNRESVDEMVDYYKTINGKNPLIRYELGFHAEYTCKEEILVELSKASHLLKCPVYSHTSETPREVEECKKRHHGLSPVEYADSLGLLDYGGGGFHGVAFSKRDMEIYAARGASLVSCPGSNAKLASGIAPLVEMEEKGINLGLGTDGPGSNNGLDMFYEMRLACVLQKLRLNDPSAFKGNSALKAATVGSAKAMGLLDSLYVDVGQRADLLLIDLNRPNMRPFNDLPNNLVYSGAKDDVKMTMVEGRPLYLDGRFNLPQSVDSIIAEAEEVTARLKKEYESR